MAVADIVTLWVVLEAGVAPILMEGDVAARLGKLFGMLLCLATCCESHPSNLTRDAHRPQGIHHYNEPSIA